MNIAKLNYYYSRVLQELAYRTRGSYGRPTEAILLLTNRCNARCLHCHSWKLKAGPTEMTPEEWKGTLDELRSWLGPIFISITGGDPLLKEGSMEILRHACVNGFWTEFLTNGYLMTAKKASGLIDTGVRRIKISLDGSKPPIHNTIRGKKDSFEKVIRAFELLVSEKRRTGGDVQLMAKTTIMNLNVEDLPNIVLLVNKMGIDTVEFQALEPIYYSKQLLDPHWYRHNPLWVEDTHVVVKSVDMLKALKKQGYAIANSMDNLELIKDYFISPRCHSYKVHAHEYNKKMPECTSFTGSLQIMPDGRLKMCHWMNPFGNARKEQIRRAWKNRTPCWKDTCTFLKVMYEHETG